MDLELGDQNPEIEGQENCEDLIINFFEVGKKNWAGRDKLVARKVKEIQSLCQKDMRYYNVHILSC